MKRFPSKILLFGEHIINVNAHALAIPNSNFYAQLSFDHKHCDRIKESTLILDKIYTYLKSHPKLKSIYNLKQLKEDIDNGLCILMNIPVGYGLGSSGAIVAGIFDKYAIEKDFSNNKLKKILGETEGVFHGKSSGLDPLVSYLNEAVFIDKKIKIVKIDNNWQQDFSIFLLNSKLPRKTGPLVEIFLQKVKEDVKFKEVLNKQIIPTNNQIVANFLNNKHQKTLPLIKQLSEMQFKYMSEFILSPQKSIWQKGLNSNTFFMKICGAGGGGFYLCFSKSKSISGFTRINF